MWCTNRSTKNSEVINVSTYSSTLIKLIFVAASMHHPLGVDRVYCMNKKSHAYSMFVTHNVYMVPRANISTVFIQSVVISTE
jgi:hypothetical protein